MPALSLTTPTIQMTVPFVWRTSAASLLIAGTTPREAGTSTGAPGARNAFCMSTTTNAVFLGSRLSKGGYDLYLTLSTRLPIFSV